MATTYGGANFGHLSPFSLLTSSATAAAGSPTATAAGQNQEGLTIERDFLSVWGTNVNALQLGDDRRSRVQDTELGGRARRAMQRAFASMGALAQGGAAAGGSPLGGNNKSPLGLSSNPVGKSKFGA